MKRILVVMLSLVVATFAFGGLGGCTPRSKQLLIYNWGEYMPESVYKGFEKWYKDKTGEKVKVVYSEFDTNETMYTEIAKGGADYDLACPSEYMVQIMAREGRLKELSDETKAIVAQKINPKIMNMLAPGTEKYCMPYIWGTMGIMYDSRAAGQNDESMGTWEVLFDGSFGKKVYMKDSFREAYSVAMLKEKGAMLLDLAKDGYNNEEYQTELNKIFSLEGMSDAEIRQSVTKAQEILSAQTSHVTSYEVDSAKIELMSGGNYVGNYGLFWSCDAGYVMFDNEEGEGNQHLRYVVPEEGSNVWVDSFVIPQHAKNTKAANMFIQYLCTKEGVGFDCMDEVGSAIAVESEAEAYEAYLRDEENDIFDGTPEGFKDMYINMMFPSDQVLLRCAIMRDFGDYNELLGDMWENAKP